MKKNDGGIIELEEERARKKAAVRERKKKPKMKVSGKSVFGLQKIMRKHQGAAPAAGAAPKFP
ncbi:hypothetical protein KKB98_00765 [Patescibacteria group bacterium]|nr:hypothetical protein [Patescibacteria group bacterium]MCG2809232.1 hypothetical protein [Candidatus Portnoybacteria bacterium]